MTFISRAARYVLRKRVRTAVLFIVLTIITASMLSATAVSQAAQHEAGQIEKQAVGGFVLASNLQGSMLTPRGGGMVRPADVQRISKLSGGRLVHGQAERHRRSRGSQRGEGPRRR